MRNLPFYLVLLAFALTAPAFAGEMKVTLFGQPCVLKGPLEESSLKAIHAISPEQAYPEFALDAARFRTALEAVNKATGIPAALDHYREKLGLRLEAQAGFFDGLDSAKKAGSVDPLLAVTKRFRQVKQSRPFEKLARKLQTKDITSANTAFLQQLFDAYNDAIEPDPEEEFHRAIRKIKVQYVCTFEESEEGETE